MDLETNKDTKALPSEETIPSIEQKKSGNLIWLKFGLLVFLVLFIGFSLFVIKTGKLPSLSFQTYQMPTKAVEPSPTQTAITVQKEKISQDFFLTAVPKSREKLTPNDFPQDSLITRPTFFKDHLFFIGGVTSDINGELYARPIIEFDPQAKTIVRYSNPNKGNCGDFVFVDNFLFVSCYTSIYKLDTTTYKTTAVFEDVGVPNAYLNSGNKFATSSLMALGDNVWFATSNGFGVINAKTDKVKIFMHTSFSSQDGNMYADMRQALLDGDHLWYYSDYGGFHGLVLVDNKNVWNVQNGHEFAKYDLPVLSGQNSIEGMISATDGVTISLYSFDRQNENPCTVMHYVYATKEWKTLDLNQDQNLKYLCTEDRNAIANNLVTNGYPTQYKTDANNLSQAINVNTPLGKQTYSIDGRAYYFLSPVINGKRYILTSAGIDSIDNKSNFSKIFLTLGSIAYTGEIANPNPRSAILIDPITNKGVVITSSPPNHQDFANFDGETKIWIIDFTNATILKKLSFAANDVIQTSLNQEPDMSKLHLEPKDNSFQIPLQNGQKLVIEFTNNTVSLSK